jgi:UDP-3-O-[3-hydroxymyristoyl] glucosamine N-acyltransferase
MQATANDVAGFLGGRVVGDGAAVLSGIAGLVEAKPGDLSFLANPKYAVHLPETRASAVLVAAEQPDCRPTQIIVANPDHAFNRIIETFGPKPSHPAPGIHPSAVIGERTVIGAGARIGAHVVTGSGCSIGANVVIHPNVVLGADCALGDDSVIYANVAIRERCRLGARVVVQPGAVIGSDGFGFVLLNGKHHKSPQVGVVVIEDDVEIGACCCIDRARFGVTRIGAGTKIDNLVQIAHNVELGAHCLIVAQVGIAGSTRLGNYVTLAGQVGVAGHITLADQTVVTAQSGVSKSTAPKAVLRGSPARENRAALSQEIALRHLPETQQTVRNLEARIADLERRLSALSPKQP